MQSFLGERRQLRMVYSSFTVLDVQLPVYILHNIPYAQLYLPGEGGGLSVV